MRRLLRKYNIAARQHTVCPGQLWLTGMDTISLKAATAIKLNFELVLELAQGRLRSSTAPRRGAI